MPSASRTIPTLGALLARVDSLESLRPVLAALGHEPLNEPVPGLVARPTHRDPGTALAVGRNGAFAWFAVAGADPERLARRVARRLAARGRTAGVLALDTERRQLGLSVAFGRNPSLLVDLDCPRPDALASVVRLSRADEGALAFAARVAEALSGEAVGRRFFREFKATLDRMSAALPTRLRGDDRRSLALLQLTRVLFLYFIQAKGWLGGRERFLADAVDSCLARKRCIHRDLLRPLFFGTLNRPDGGAKSRDPPVRRDPVSQRRPVRAAPARARAPG